MVGQPEEAAWSLEDVVFEAPPSTHKVSPVEEALQEAIEKVPEETEDEKGEVKVDEFSPENLCSRKLSTGSGAFSNVNHRRELCKGVGVLLTVIALTAMIILALALDSASFQQPDCPDRWADIQSCEPCGSGTFVLPLFGEYEKAWPKSVRAILYLASLLWAFAGMGMVCDRFMEGIEEITSAEHVVWIELSGGTKRKFHRQVWNATVANLTLMALGSSAPEIMLSAIELVGREYYAGTLGPSTIVGTAAFNLLVITAICISAIPAPEVRKIELVDVFGTTTVMSLWAYVWLIIILLVSTPDRVDLWESIATLVMFPVLVVAAFIADKRYLRRGCDVPQTPPHRNTILRRMQDEGDTKLPLSMLRLLQETSRQAMRPKISSFAEAHSYAMKVILGQSFGMARGLKRKVAGLGSTLRIPSATTRHKRVQDIFFGFREESHVVMECVGMLPVVVEASSPTGRVVELKYQTVAGSAKAGVRFQHVQGTLIFGPSQTEKIIRIPIVDNDIWDPDEVFYVELQDLDVKSTTTFTSRTAARISSKTSKRRSKDGKQLGINNERLVLKTHRTTIKVLNDDEPSEVCFEEDEIQVEEGTVARLMVGRLGGTKGTVQCSYHCADGSAIGGKDFEAVSGTLTFEDGERWKSIDVPILVSRDHAYEDAESFSVVLSQASPGVKFISNSDRCPDCAVCDIVIAAGIGRSAFVRLIRRWWNRDRAVHGVELWYHQLSSVVYCNGSPEEQAEATCVDWFFHVFTLHWKLLFVVVPPSLYMGGWACFWMALVMIGAVTAFVGDIASLIGCCIGIPEEITAITLVALGTSLPDTLASKTAAQQDDTADNSIGNIVGSNCVNVFLGLGISWTMGAVYWKMEGATPRWRSQVLHGQTYEELFLQPGGPGGGFVVPAGKLLFSVCFYTFTALLCIALLIFRRIRYGGELGGPEHAQKRDSCLLVILWCIYVICVSVYSATTSG